MARRKRNGAGLGGFLGSMIGLLLGSIAGPAGGYIGSVVGGTIGGQVGAPADRKRRGAIGAGVGSVILGPLGSAVGGYVGDRKPDEARSRRNNPGRRRRSNLGPGQRVRINAEGYPGHSICGEIVEIVVVKGIDAAHIELEDPVNGQSHSLVALDDLVLENPRRGSRKRNVETTGKEFDIYEKMLEAGVPIENRESDLYVPYNETTKKIVKDWYAVHRGHVSKPDVFTGRDGKKWFDIPYAYKPWWEQRTAEWNQRSANPSSAARRLASGSSR